MGPNVKQASTLAMGGGAQQDFSGTRFGISGKSAGQDFVKNPVPLEGGNPEDDGSGTQPPKDVDWLQVARENHMTSQNWFDISIRRRVEDNLAHTYSRHASGSKYYTTDFDKRSRYFRPKTRGMLRKQEAACALAFFSTMDVVNCEPVDSDDDNQVLAAAIHNALLNYRLVETIPWFKTLLGGYFDAMTQGVVISCQEWTYQEVTIIEDEYDQEGQQTGKSRQSTKVQKDTSSVRLIPVENLQLHPSCNWVDPINSSPYLIEKIPWFAEELADHIKKGRSYGSQVPYIKDFTVNELMAGQSEGDNSSQVLRQARENVRLDRFSQAQQGQHNRPVWVHRNIVRKDGQDFVYETLGCTILLSNPVPLEDVFGMSRRPYVMGSCTIEAHRPYPSGPVEILKPTQEYMNDIQNQRNDNIRLALNNRYLVKRGQMVDLRSLMRNVPGSITQSTDPANDVKQLETKDVTSSSYQEQDRLNLDFDDVAGVFAQSTIGAARNMNERVRGMELLGQGADLITELALRTLSETWVAPVLKQLVELTRIFETDQVVLGVAASTAEGAGGWQEAFRALSEPINVNVNVGFGNTDPMQRIQRLATGITAIGQMAPAAMQEIDPRAVAHEVMGALGYKNGIRFFPGLKSQGQQDPQVQQLQQQVQQLQQQIQSDQAKYDNQLKIAQIKANSTEKIAQLKAQYAGNVAMGAQAAKHYIAEMTYQIAQINTQILHEKNVIAQANLLLEREALANAIMQADREFQLKVATSAAVPAQAEPQVEIPGQDMPFIQGLESPGSGSVVTQFPTDGKQPRLPGPDGAGVIQRGNFGQIPNKAG